ncbi:putative Ricin B lectin protein [Pseudoloma neurophilia]|uniref:Putative Ricin B lectin protein n=1 Tax=Pseudoloma neurophilia TaxID=146866 RepID=A0A0R0LWX5_9MICR|nr:putative Ricin B lectin protein [Pseudoloma neurophilia]
MLLFFTIFKNVVCRQVRLKHSIEDYYVGGSDFYPIFNYLDQSDVFIDEPSPIPGKIVILVANKNNKVWDIETSDINMIYYTRHNGSNQIFKVIHLGKDVVAIESELGGCLELNRELNRFQLKPCQRKENYRAQTFLITDLNGKWHGSGSYETGWGGAAEGEKWGQCSTCIQGGFGSEQRNLNEMTTNFSFWGNRSSSSQLNQMKGQELFSHMQPSGHYPGYFQNFIKGFIS